MVMEHCGEATLGDLLQVRVRAEQRGDTHMQHELCGAWLREAAAEWNSGRAHWKHEGPAAAAVLVGLLFECAAAQCMCILNREQLALSLLVKHHLLALLLLLLPPVAGEGRGS
jgi:hypothetical protein